MASIRCGHCKQTHKSVAEVLLCAEDEREAAYWAELAQAEQEAEARAERFWEERGGPEDDPRERELWALEDERRRESACRHPNCETHGKSPCVGIDCDGKEVRG